MTDKQASGLVLSGEDGSGKTVLAGEIGRILTSAGHPTAVIDLDALSQFGPKPPASPGFYDDLRVRNLAALWTTYRDAGARFIVVSGHVDTAVLRSQYVESLDGCDVQVVRLVVPADLRRQRVESRGRPSYSTVVTPHTPGVEDFIATNDADLEAAARGILSQARWPPP